MVNPLDARGLPPNLRAALTRVLAMADEMSGETSYAEVDYSRVQGGERIGVQPDVQHDLDLVRGWLEGTDEPLKKRKR